SIVLLFIFKPKITGFYQADAALFVNYFMLIIPFSFIVSAVTVTSCYCQALFKSAFTSFLSDIFIRLGIIVITVLYYNQWISFDTYLYLFIGVYAAQLLLIILYILLIDRISLLPDKSYFQSAQVRSMIRFGLTLSVASFASIALKKVDVLFLGASSLNKVAVYTTAVFIASFIEAPLGAMERISHTKIADSFARNNISEIEKIYKESVKYLLVVGGLLFVGILATTKYIYEIGKLSESYMQCIDVVYIVSFGSLINISTGFNSSIIFYSKHYTFGTFLLLLMLVVTIVLNAILIPIYGVYGAAFSSAASAILFNFIKFAFIYVKFKFQPYTISSLKISSVVIVCALLIYIFPEISTAPLLNFLVKGGLVSLLYLGAVYWLKLAPELFETIGLKAKR
ncbi:MAG: lipopolysaccharide biosynthesis protein, partial [Bacteroidia bacterium]